MKMFTQKLGQQQRRNVIATTLLLITCTVPFAVQAAPAQATPATNTTLKPVTTGMFSAEQDQQLTEINGLDCLLEPNKMVDVATTANGVVKTITVDRGDLIEQGQVLARLEVEVQKASVELANARVKFTAKKMARTRELYKKKMVSSQELDETVTENELAVAEYNKEIELLKQRTVRSPFTGIVVERYLSPGELVEEKPIVKIAQIDPLNVEVIAPVSMLGAFTKDAKALVYTEGPTLGPYEAKVARVDRVIDAPSGTFRVRLELPNPEHKISAGLRCKAILAEPEPTPTPAAESAATAEPAAESAAKP